MNTDEKQLNTDMATHEITCEKAAEIMSGLLQADIPIKSRKLIAEAIRVMAEEPAQENDDAQENDGLVHEYEVRILMDTVTVFTSQGKDHAEDLAMEIYESDARTHLDFGLSVVGFETEDYGPTNEDETEL